jgi:peroxiredoxin
MTKNTPSRYLPMFAMALIGMLLLAGCGAGKDASNGTNTNGQTIFTGEMTGCNGDSMRLYQVQGPDAVPVAAGAMTTADGKTTFRIELKHPGAGFYMLGPDPRQSATIVLDQPAEMVLTGNCANAKGTFNLSNAPTNDEYKAMLERVIAHNQRVQQLMQNLQIFQQSDPGQVPRFQQEMQQANTTHFAWLDSMQAKGGFISKVAFLYNFKPYMSDPSHSKYGNELEYFRQGFFEGVDLQDPAIANTPQVYEKARAYAQTLGSRFPKDQAQQSMDALLTKAEGTLASKSILRAYVDGLEQLKSELFVTYGNKYMEAYPSDPKSAGLQSKIQAMQRLAEGAEAPDFTQPNPDGKNISLSDFKGQVVMLDFWASWCRPCRMENPNVVKAYNKYHKSGFEILGVSLDKTKDKWVQAIAQDGLTWPHVSDLGGWASKPAGLYGVSSIPATFLLDREGKIMARNLRGPALEDKLKEIFGF